MEIFLPSDKLPNDNEYVLAYFKDRPWLVRGTNQHKWVVVRFVKGLSVKDRDALPNSDKRKNTYTFCDEWSNNEVPYAWDALGGGQFFGQEITCWCYLPIPIK